jgi:hypothetical protein
MALNFKDMNIVEENSDEFFNEELSNHSGAPMFTSFEDIDLHSKVLEQNNAQ